MPLDSLFYHYSKNVPWLHCQRKCILLDYRQSSLVTRYLLLRHNSVIYVDIYSLAMALIPDHVLIQFHSRKKIKKWTSLSFTLSFNPSWALFNMPRLEIQEETDWSIPACCNHRLEEYEADTYKMIFFTLQRARWKQEGNEPRECHVLSQFSCVQFFATLWTVACQAPLSMGFPRQKYWSESPCPPPADLRDPGIEPTSLMSPALAGRLFTTSATWVK